MYQKDERRGSRIQRLGRDKIELKNKPWPTLSGRLRLSHRFIDPLKDLFETDANFPGFSCFLVKKDYLHHIFGSVKADDMNDFCRGTR